jgi:hypothetical protein
MCAPCLLQRSRRVGPPLPRPGADSFLNHRALELGKYAQHLKHGFAGGRRGVEPLLMQEKVDAQRVQLGQEGIVCGSLVRRSMNRQHPYSTF